MCRVRRVLVFALTGAIAACDPGPTDQPCSPVDMSQDYDLVVEEGCVQEVVATTSESVERPWSALTCGESACPRVVRVDYAQNLEGVSDVFGAVEDWMCVLDVLSSTGGRVEFEWNEIDAVEVRREHERAISVVETDSGPMWVVEQYDRNVVDQDVTRTWKRWVYAEPAAPELLTACAGLVDADELGRCVIDATLPAACADVPTSEACEGCFPEP